MAKFECKTHSTGLPASTIEADDYDLDMKAEKLTFFDADRDQIASFSVSAGAYVKRTSN